VVDGARDPGRRLLVLGAGPAQLGLLQAARERGLFVIACDRDPAAPGFRHADRRAIVSTEDEPSIERLAAAERVEGVISPGSDWPVGIAARVAAKLGIPHPIDAATAVLATSKMRQRERFAAAGVPQPRYAVCRDLGEAEEAVRAIGLPCVLKAPDRQGQKGLALVRELEELAAAVTLALAASRSGLCLVEEAVDGPEVTVNAFSSGGRFTALTVTDRETAEPPAFGVALAHVWPSRLPAEDVMDCVDAARAAAEALGIADGPTYTQIVVGPAGPRVGELAARLGGGHDAELCAAALGVDLNGLALAAAVGDPAEIEYGERAGGACTRFLVAPPGALEGVEGVEDALAVDGVLSVRIYREPGYIFVPLRRGGDRAGAVLAVGADRHEAVDRARRAAERVRFGTVDAEALV
jgi:biotin carboxylase